MFWEEEKKEHQLFVRHYTRDAAQTSRRVINTGHSR
jgi:hypothetical protein